MTVDVQLLKFTRLSRSSRSLFTLILDWDKIQNTVKNDSGYHTKNEGEIAPGVPINSTICFWDTGKNRRGLHGFRPFFDKKQTWIRRRCNRRKNIQISAQGVLQAPKTQFSGFTGGMFVLSVYVKRHNFGRRKSFQGLANLPRMCLLYVSFD